MSDSPLPLLTEISMQLIWWIVPALAGIMGIMLSFAGLGRLLKLRLAAGALRFTSGIGMLGFAGVAAFTGLNLQTYERLTYEQLIATISFDKSLEADETFSITLGLPDGRTQLIRQIKGDEFSLGAQIITFRPMAQMLGYDSVYRLEYIEGRYARRYNTQNVTTAQSTGLQLSENPGLDVFSLAQAHGQPLGIETSQQDARFGSAVYAPMADGLVYEVSLTQSALVLRPGNQAARQILQTSE